MGSLVIMEYTLRFYLRVLPNRITSGARGYTVMQHVDTPESAGGLKHSDEAAHLGDVNGVSALRPRLRRIILITIRLI